MRRCHAFCCFSLTTTLIAIACGCRGDVELLEARLRDQERSLSEADRQLQEQSAQLAESRRSQWLLEQKVAEISGGQVAPEQITLPARVSSIEIDELFAAIVPTRKAGTPGKVSLVFAPVDSEGSIVRIPGDVTIRCQQSSGFGQVSLSEQKVDLEESLALWKSAVIGSGYQIEFDLPEGQSPDSTWNIEVEFRTSDGRTFNDGVELDFRSISGESPFHPAR